MSSVPLEESARRVLETVPLIMRAVRAEMRRQSAADLSVPQFRTLIFLSRQAGASLSQVAEHIGLTLPSISVLVGGLVERGLVRREAHAADRRRVTLTLTERGESVLAGARDATQAALAARLSVLSPEDRATVAQALQLLRPIFDPSAGEAGR